MSLVRSADLASACRDLKLEDVRRLLMDGHDPNQLFLNPHEEGHMYAPLHALLLSNSRFPLKDPRLNIRAKILKELLLYGADPSMKGNKGNTSLHIAAALETSRLAIIKMLATAGAHFHIENKASQNPMEILLQNRATYKEMKYFIECGAVLNGSNRISDEGYLAQALKSCSMHDVMKVIADVDGCLGLDEKNRNLIHNCISTQKDFLCVGVYKLVIQWCLRIGLDIDAEDYIGDTPLKLAIKYKNLPAISGLIMAGCDVDFPSFKFFLCENVSYMIDTAIFNNHCQNILGFKTRGDQLYKFYEKTVITTDSNRHILAGIEETKKIKFGRFSLYNFLIESDLFTHYSRMSAEEREQAYNFFNNLVWPTIYNVESRWVDRTVERTNDALTNVLLIQFSKTRAYETNKEIVFQSLNKFIRYPVPYVCIKIILDFLDPVDLKHLVFAINYLS